MTYNGQDALAEGLDLRHATPGVQLVVTIAVDGGTLDAHAPEGCVVVLWPAGTYRGNQPHRIYSAWGAIDGSRMIRGIAPGEYRIAALKLDQADQWRLFDPELMAEFQDKAEVITIAPNAREIKTLTAVTY